MSCLKARPAKLESFSASCLAVLRGKVLNHVIKFGFQSFSCNHTRRKKRYSHTDKSVRRSLTLNLGLRYEMTTVPTEINGKLVNLRNIMDPPASAHLGDPLFSNPTKRNFEPRIGFAWDPLHNGKMAIRGGAGLFDVLPLPYEFTLMESLASPFFVYTSIGSPGSGSFFSTIPNPPPPRKSRSTYIDSNPKRNFVTQWNLNLQYQLTPSLAAMVAYVGSRGVHQPFRVDEA